MSLNTILATAPLTSTGYHLKATGTTLGQSLIWDNGTNVGIGNQGTTYTLDVSGTGRFTGQLITNSTSFPLDIYGTTNNYGLRINNVQAATLFLYSSNANAASRNWGLFTNSEVYGDFDIRQSNAINGDLTNGANSTSRFYIKNNGNVGIGTSSPSYLLDVNGMARILRNGGDEALRISNDNGYIGFFNTANSTRSGYLQGNTTSIQLSSSLAIPIQFLTSDSERMRITSGGNVGIGNTGAADQRLSLSGVDNTSSNYALVVKNSSLSSLMYIRNDGYAWITGTAWNYGSDYRLKENLYDVENGLDMVLKMKPKHFDYIDGQKDNLGFIAQDVQEIIPQAVSVSNKETGMLALKTDFLVPYLVKAIQEMNTKLEELSKQNEELSNRLIKLESK